MFRQPQTLAFFVLAGASFALAGPCDIYDAGGTPCVAAHSTTRALYSDYSDSLYQVRRASDGRTVDVTPLSVGGVADSITQDIFCAGTTCLITVIYDQTGIGNHLTQAPPGSFRGPDVDGFDNLASAIAAPVTLNGYKAYGVFISPGSGYRNNRARGIAVEDEPEGMYAVVDGTHFNGGCCFDYGNAEPSGRDTGNGHMEAIYFGSSTGWGTGTGTGPWIMADFENGLFSGKNAKNNAGDPSIKHRFVTATLKGKPNQWSIRGGDAEGGRLSTFYSGERPDNGYDPMKKEGAILLGIGGDNSISGQGTFYEGVMTTGYPSDATENAVQADIVSAGYETAPLTSGPSFSVGSSVSFRLTTSGLTARYLAHKGSGISTPVVSSSSKDDLKKQATWLVRTGLGNRECFSFESRETPGSFIRHYDNKLTVAKNDNGKQFGEDATFCPQAGLNGQGNSLRSWNYPTRYLRHYAGSGYIASNGGVHNYDTARLFNDDATFVTSRGFA